MRVPRHCPCRDRYDHFDPFNPNAANHLFEAEQPPEAPDAKIAIAFTSIRRNSQQHLPALRIRNAFEFHHLTGYRSQLVCAPHGDWG